MKLPKELEQLCDDLRTWLPRDEIQAIAMECGYEVQESPLGGVNFLLIHLLGAMDDGMGSSLTQLCGQASRLGISTAKTSLQSRYTSKASEYMKRISQVLMGKVLGSPVQLSVLPEFSGVYVSDSTCVELPSHLEELYKGFGGSASVSALKIDATFDLQSDWSVLRLKDGCAADHNHILGPPKNSLWLRDLGYYKIEDFANLDKQGALFISRARLDTRFYVEQEGDHPLDLVKMIDEVPVDQYQDRSLYVGQTHRLPFRVVIQRVPNEVAQQRREDLARRKKKKGRKISQRRLALCALNVYITNLEVSQWQASQIQQLYKIRWQIELIFKIWKSHLNLEKVQRMNPYRFECALYALLIYITLQYRLQQKLKQYYWENEQIELSEIKINKLLNIQKDYIKQLLVGVNSAARQLISVLYQQLHRIGVKEVRYRNKNPLFNIC